jgi:hypothetical protein
MDRVSEDAFEMYSDPEGTLYVLSVKGIYYMCFAEFQSHPEVVREFLEHVKIQFDKVQAAFPERNDDFCFQGRLEAILYYKLMEFNNIRLDRFALI